MKTMMAFVRRFLYLCKKRLLFIFAISFMCPLHVLSREETISYLKQHKCSMARFGNGEMDIMLGDSKNFQVYNKRLNEELRNIKTNEKILVCVPFVLENKNARKQLSNAFYSNHRKLYLYYWRKLFQKNTVLGDTNLTRFYYDMKDKDDHHIGDYICLLKSLWYNKDVVIVEGYFTRLGIGNNLFDNVKSIKRVVCPSENAYDVVDKIEEYITSNIVVFDNLLLLVALGPTATVLVNRLSDKGYLSYDIGHVDIEYEWFLRKTGNKKVVIPGKYVNEVDEGRVIKDDIDLEHYLQQILIVIK